MASQQSSHTQHSSQDEVLPDIRPDAVSNDTSPFLQRGESGMQDEKSDIEHDHDADASPLRE
jgi:hypothetical protein